MVDASEELTPKKFESLEKLATKNFLRFAVTVQHMSVEAQLALIAQLPEFRKLATEAFESLDRAFESTLRSNDTSEAYVHAAYRTSLDALTRMLENPDLTLDDQLRIVAKMAEIAEAQDRKDTESKVYKLAMLRQGALSKVAIVGLVVLAVAGGGFALSQNGDDNKA